MNNKLNWFVQRRTGVEYQRTRIGGMMFSVNDLGQIWLKATERDGWVEVARRSNASRAKRAVESIADSISPNTVDPFPKFIAGVPMEKVVQIVCDWKQATMGVI